MKIKRILSIFLSILLGLALLYAILHQVGIKNAAVYLAHLNYLWILSALALYTVDMLIRSYRWKEILKDNGIFIGIIDSFLAYNLGNSQNIIIPAKVGDVARSYYLKKRYGHDYSKTLPATFLDRFFDMIGVYIVILVSGIYVVSSISMPRWIFNLIFAGIICLAAAFIVIGFVTAKHDAIEKIKYEKFKNFMASAIEVLEGSIKNRNKFLILLICSILIWTCDGLFTFMIFLSMKQAVNPFIAIFASMTATLTKIFPITPGGIGVFEGAMVVIFSSFNFDKQIIGVLSTLTHFLMNAYTIAIGMYVLLKNNISVSQINMEKVKNR